MIIELGVADGSVALAEPEVFGQFSVLVRGTTDPAQVRSLVESAGLGHLRQDAQHVVVDPEAVRRMAGRLADEDWERGFAGMCSYAAGKGWMEDGGILAHIEWGDA